MSTSSPSQHSTVPEETMPSRNFLLRGKRRMYIQCSGFSESCLTDWYLPCQTWGADTELAYFEWLRTLAPGNKGEWVAYCCSVQFSCSVVSDSLWPRELQHARPPCPSQTSRVYSNSCPSSQWCHPTITQSSVVPFSSCPQSLPASGSFPVSQLFPWGSQSTGVSASASVLPMNTQDWSPLGWTGWISLQSKGLSRVFSNTIVQKHQFFSSQLSS